MKNSILIYTSISIALCSLLMSCGRNASESNNLAEDSIVCDSSNQTSDDTNPGDTVNKEAANHTTLKTLKDNLIIFTPNYSKIDLVCGNMPSKNNKSVIYCAEAAFTGELQDKFDHSNIAGKHVSGGIFYKGYSCKRNTGTFVYYDGQYKFLYKDSGNGLSKAAENGGMGFSQEMMIHNGKKVKTYRSDSNENEFRALTELNGKLCIIDTNGSRRFGDFITELLNIGVTEAIYLDMGPGWNYSWYRTEDDSTHEIHKARTRYTTNWITFYR